MSDRRVKYIILASIIFVGIVGISQGQGLFELNDVNTIMPNTSLGYYGHVAAVLKDSDGNIKSYIQADNIVGSVGRNCAADLVFDTGLGTDCSMVMFMAIGSSGSSFVFTQTNLFDKTENGNVLLLTSDIVGAFTDDADGGGDAVLTYDKAFIISEEDSGEEISETGLFDSASLEDANMFARATFSPPFPVTTDDELTIRWTITTTIGIIGKRTNNIRR